jgi:hypothetical protein
MIIMITYNTTMSMYRNNSNNYRIIVWVDFQATRLLTKKNYRIILGPVGGGGVEGSDTISGPGGHGGIISSGCGGSGGTTSGFGNGISFPGGDSGGFGPSGFGFGSVNGLTREGSVTISGGTLGSISGSRIGIVGFSLGNEGDSVSG